MTGLAKFVKAPLRGLRRKLMGGERNPPQPEAYTDPVRNAAATEFEVDLWILSWFVLERLVPAIGIRPYPLNEQLLAAAAICRLKPGVVFDWGTYRGASARLFWECARAFRLEFEIHSIDLPAHVPHIEHPGEERGRLVRGLPGVHLHLGDGVTVALEQWERQQRPVRPLFMVDGDHTYATVRGELDRIFATVPDASAIVHDTFFQSRESGYNVGPADAVREIAARRPERFKVLHSGPGLPGMTLLASKAAIASAA